MRKRDQRALAKGIVYIFVLPFILLLLLFKVIMKIIKSATNKKKKKDIVIKEYYTEETYSKRDLLTECEKEFLNKLNSIFKDKYIVQPQIPLRMIIEKSTDKLNKYANELHRYIDYGIFDKNYKLLALVELNDETHKEYERYKRDIQVNEICKQAKIPLITFWTHGKQTDENIRYIIEKEIESANENN